MSYKVSMAHSAADKAWVDWIASNAASVGVEVYLYEHDRQPGVLIANKKAQAIQRPDALLVSP